MNTLVSVITVNYNESAATCEMLESLYASGYPKLEVFVVDNASPADHPEIIKERFPQVVFIQSNKNLGFAGGNNLALRKAGGEYIYLLNNDTIVPERHIQELVHVLQTDKTAGVVCPKIKWFDDPDIIMFAGYTELTPYTLRNRITGYGEKDTGQYNLATESAYAHGAAMMLKREVTERVGYMNEQYFLYYEEIDWSSRIRKAGYRIVYAPSTFILHRESLSTGRDSPLKSYCLNRNRVLYLLRNVSGCQKIIGMFYQMTVVMPKNILVCMLRGKWKNARAIMRAWGWCVLNITRQSQ
jgi:GT2 family glycosyltransferase